MMLINERGEEIKVGSEVTEHNKANGRQREGWFVDAIVTRGIAVMVKVKRECQHIEKDGMCHHDWCSGQYSKMVYASTIKARVVRDVVSSI